MKPKSFTDWVLEAQEELEEVELLESGFDSDDIDLIIEKRGNYDNFINEIKDWITHYR